MNIKSAKTFSVSKWIEVSVSYKKKDFKVSVLMKNGSVVGNGAGDGIYTSYLTYFNEVPEHVRQSHFYKIKKYVERYIH